MTVKPNISSIAGNKGTTTVEFAVIAGLLLVILFGILEFGVIFMQHHLVDNAAREGVRIGVRANNFDRFTTLVDNATENCQAATDRGYKVDCEVRNYLQHIYGRDETKVSVSRQAVDGNERLAVTVTVPNVFPGLLSGLVPGFSRPAEISYTASGDYEDPAEASHE